MSARNHLLATMALCIGIPFGIVAETAQANSIAETITEGKVALALRYRLELVDQDGLNKTAAASTLRTRLSYRTAKRHSWSGFIEFDDLSYLGDDPFNNTRNGKSEYPVIADPRGTGVNQAYLAFEGEKSSAVIGRQRINLDNQRFVGGVGWRQNEQTYDAFTVSIAGSGNTSLSYRYLDRVQRIFGPSGGSPSEAFDSDSHLLNANIDLGPGAISGYAYLLDFDNAATLSSRTLGAAYSGKLERGEVSLPFRIEYARQTDAADNPFNYSVSYLHATLGVSRERWSFDAGLERLGTDSGHAFSTPLATLHKFNGWADKFLSTPAGGLQDLYFRLALPVGPGKFSATVHDFDAESGSARYGRELDVSYGLGLGDHVDLLLKAARYNAQAFGSDTTKVWIMVTAAF